METRDVSGGIRVLVVDDHPLHREGAHHTLAEQPDLQVVGEAATGERALELVDALQPDVVLMDVRLPGITGIETTREIIRRHPTVRVLLVSAYEDDEYVRGALAAGACGYLLKTAPGSELVQAVRAVATGATVLESSLVGILRAAAEAPPVERLTDRELEVLALLASGLRNKEIASRLALSRRTVERHCGEIYAKLGASSRTEAVMMGVERGLVGVGTRRAD